MGTANKLDELLVLGRFGGLVVGGGVCFSCWAWFVAGWGGIERCSALRWASVPSLEPLPLPVSVDEEMGVVDWVDLGRAGPLNGR